MIRLNASNNAATTLVSDITDTDTAIQVTNSSLFPSPPFRATLVAGNNIEIIEVTEVNSNTWTIIRGQEGTAPRSWSAGTNIELRWTAGMYSEIQNTVNALETSKAEADLSNVADSDILNKIKNVDGDGSGLDADMVDGHHIYVQATEPASPNVNDIWIVT